MQKTKLRNALLTVALAGLCASPGAAEAQPAEKLMPQVWELPKLDRGGVYTGPMRPIWRLSDLKKMHAGQSNWQQLMVRDGLQNITYNSAAPGTKFGTRLLPDAASVFVVIAGEIHFTVEGQQPVTATRGSVLNILHSTPFSYDVEGAQNALWIEINPYDFKVVYPEGGQLPPPGPGRHYEAVRFNKNEASVLPIYTAPNQLHFNTFDIAANCKPSGTMVQDDHISIHLTPRYGTAAENKCGTQSGGDDAAPAPKTAFNPHSKFGHMHIGQAEWWILQAGGTDAKFENAGEFHGTEGDFLYAPPSTWHEMAPEGPGLDVRMTSGTYPEINMYSVKSK